MPPLRLATRGSPLALWQAQRVRSLLEGAGVVGSVELVVVETTGDRRVDLSLAQIGGQGVFVKEVQAAVLAGVADAAVHSAKDLPASTPRQLALAAVPERADVRDALVGTDLAGIATGALVATGSARRRAQLAWLRPDIGFTDLRGNMATRLQRAAQVGTGVVAACALDRLGLADRITERLAPELVLPQVGQGAIAVECRAGDAAVRGALAEIDDDETHRCLVSERSFLARLGGGCTLPVGALAVHSPPAGLELHAFMASGDGSVVVRCSRTGTEPELLGHQLAEDLLDHAGGSDLGTWPAQGRSGPS